MIYIRLKKTKAINNRILRDIKPFVNKYNWEGMHFPWEKDDRKKFEKTYITITIRVLHGNKRKI